MTPIIKELLEEALNRFHVTSNRHLMSLFTEAGQEVLDAHDETVAAAGVRAGELLVLRQSQVKGGHAG
ncbi:MAG: hypothetical protein WBF51_02150 [Candidatus Dormiibacterota bacterium]